jgi:hypothetical protein
MGSEFKNSVSVCLMGQLPQALFCQWHQEPFFEAEPPAALSAWAAKLKALVAHRLRGLGSKLSTPPKGPLHSSDVST